MIQRRNSDLGIEERFTRDINRLPEKDLDRIARAYRQLLESVGEDADREGLRRTPDRAARAFEFLTQGYRQDLEEIINDAVFASAASEIILVKDIELYSLCEHHFGRCRGSKTSLHDDARRRKTELGHEDLLFARHFQRRRANSLGISLAAKGLIVGRLCQTPRN